MNNNRNNNRRRGRNNRGQGGGNQGNRIDSRARGNAPQLLEKYKKLAHDASLNGDRVQTEYYLQFADHYFRVIADSKSQKDEPRGRRDERDQDDGGNDRNDFEDASNRREGERGRRDEADEGRRDYESDEAADENANPFVRENKPRRGRRTASNGAAPEPAGLDPESLPPSIGANSDADEEAPRPRRRARKSRGTDGGDETLEAVG